MADTSHEEIGILTVGRLREMLADVDGDTQVCVATKDWYENIDGVIVPGPDNDTNEFSAVTFFTADTFDTRQF